MTNVTSTSTTNAQTGAITTYTVVHREPKAQRLTDVQMALLAVVGLLLICIAIVLFRRPVKKK